LPEHQGREGDEALDQAAAHEQDQGTPCQTSLEGGAPGRGAAVLFGRGVAERRFCGRPKQA